MGKEACVLQRRDGCREGLQNSCLRVGSPGIMRTWGKFALQLTARQYGEVVLPDESTGQSPGSLVIKLSRCKEGMARVFAVMVQILLSITRVAVQVKSEPRNYHRLQS